MKCTNCNKSIPNDSEFCQYCGFSIVSQSKTESNQKIEFSPEDTKVENGSTKKLYKTRFCKKCGASVNLKTKKCNGCGKQYFKMNFKFTKTKLAGLICILVIIALIVVLNYQNRTIDSMQRKVQDKATSIISLQHKLQLFEDERNKALDDYYSLSGDYNDSVEKSDFLDTSIALVVDNNTDLYHTYDCVVFKTADTYWAYNIEAAQAKGYSPCKLCH